MASYSSKCIKAANEWIDEIDDIDAFLDELVQINEKSISSPFLDDFCASFSVATINLSTDVQIEKIESIKLFDSGSISLSDCFSEMSSMLTPYSLSKDFSDDKVEKIMPDELMFNVSSSLMRDFTTLEVSHHQYSKAA